MKETVAIVPLAANISAKALLSFSPFMSLVWASLSGDMTSVVFSVTRKRCFSSSRLVTLAITVWPSWKAAVVSLMNLSAIAYRKARAGEERWRVSYTFLVVPKSLFTHRLGCKTDKAIWELHKDAVGHDVFDPANQLHSYCDFREVFGKHSFFQRASHCWFLREGLFRGAAKENNLLVVKNWEMCTFTSCGASEAGSNHITTEVLGTLWTGYNILFVLAEAHEVWDVVTLLQAFPQQRAVRCVIRKVQGGKHGPDLVRQDGHLQAVSWLLQHPRLQALHPTDTCVEYKMRSSKMNDTQTGVPWWFWLTLPTSQSEQGVTVSSDSPSIAALNDSTIFDFSGSHWRTLAFSTWQSAKQKHLLVFFFIYILWTITIQGALTQTNYLYLGTCKIF